MSDTKFSNGIDATTGDYLAAPQSLAAIGQALRDHADFKLGEGYVNSHDLDLVDDVDAEDLSLAGWGVVFAPGADPAVREALAPLLDLRKEQATRQSEALYRDLSVPFANCREKQSVEDFLQLAQRDGGPPVDPGDFLVDPKLVPYYLLLVGSPEEIDLNFQYDLDVSYAVGRLHFDTPAEYAHYAETVIAAERRRQARRAVVFGVRNGTEEGTGLMIKRLAEAVLDELQARFPEWSLEPILGEAATHQRLAATLRQPASLLLTVSHGLYFRSAHARRRAEQGAIVCSDWSGTGPVGLGTYFSGADVASDSDLGGMVMFQFACCSAATPSVDAFAGLGGLTSFDPPDKPFLAALPQRLLGLPGGRGAQAVIAHVDRIWRYSFFDAVADAPRDRVFVQLLSRLLEGGRIGHAMRYLNQWYAGSAVRVSSLLSESREGTAADLEKIGRTWLIANDTRNYVILGDPAVRIHGESE